MTKTNWQITAKKFEGSKYHGVTVANGMIGIVSSPNPMEVQDMVLNGVYDYYQRGRVSNILKTFNALNMRLEVGGTYVNRESISNYEQTLKM